MDILQSQSELLSQMTTSLEAVSSTVNSINQKLQTQAEIVKSLDESFKKSVVSLKSINTSFESLLKQSEKLKKIDIKKLKKITSQIASPKLNNIPTNVTTALDTHTTALNEATRQNNIENQTNTVQTKELDKLAKNADLASNQTQAACSELDKSLTTSTENVQSGVSSLPSEEEMKKASEQSSGGSWLSASWPIAIIKGVYTLVKIGFNVMITAIDTYVGLMKTLFTLPFSIANYAVKIGNELRSEIFEKIGNKVEEFKDDFSLSSHIGKDLVRLGILAEESILESKDTQSIFARTFDKENYTGILDSVKQTMQGLGSLAEFVGPTITKSKDTVIFMERIQRALGIGIEELKYYSIDAMNTLRGLPQILYHNAEAIMSVSKKQNVDFKFLSKAFHVLRKNIVEFGHLSAMELSEVSAKLIKLKISAEDVVGIFGKVSSFEQASNMSAQLFQSFGMVIDAYDMLSANDPMQIIEQLRDGMLSTGKHFDVLNRHEKSLLKSITGLSDNALKSVFSYSNLGKSQEEIAKDMETKNPTELMTEGLREMTDVIRTIKRTLTFKNPFRAIFQGLMENTVASKELSVSSRKLSEAYEILQRSLMTIDDKEIERFTVPLNIILRRFNRIITDGTLGNLFGKGIATVSDFMQDLYVQSTGSRVDDIINDSTHMLKMLEDAKDEKLQDIYFEYQDEFFDAVLNFTIDLPTQFKTIASELGLLDKEGNLKSLTLENMSQIMISASKSEDKDVIAYAEANFGKRLDFIKALKEKLRLLSERDTSLKLKLEDVISYKGGVEGTLDRLYKGLETMLDEGTTLFMGIYSLGQSLMRGLFKGLVIGSTGLLLLLNGNIDKASTLLGEHIKGLGGENAILDFLKIDSNMFKKLTEDLELAAAKFGDKTGDKLLPAFGFILTKLYESAGDLLGIMRPLVDNIIGSIYDTLNDATIGTPTWFAAKGLKTIAGSSIARRDYRKSNEKYFDPRQKTDRDDLLAVLKSIPDMAHETRESSWRDYIQPGASIGVYSTGGKRYNDPGREIDVFDLSAKLNSIDSSLNSFMLLWQEAKREKASMPIVIKEFLKILTRNIEMLESKKSKTVKEALTLSYQQYHFNALTESLDKTWNEQSAALAQMLYMIDEVLPDLVKAKSAQDIIKLHHNDEVEVIASKQGGMLRTLATSINERFKENVSVAKTTLKMAMLNRSEEDYESDEDLIQQIAIKLEGYIDYVSNRKINIIQNNLEILEQ